jgi:hypothetical protein
MDIEITPVTKSHLESYGEGTIKEKSTGLIYEAFCEMVVEVNPNLAVHRLAEHYETTKRDDVEIYVEQIFEEVASDEVKNILTVKQKEQWTTATERGIVSYLNEYQ